MSMPKSDPYCKLRRKSDEPMFVFLPESCIVNANFELNPK